MLYAQDRWSVLLVFQAMDAAGKDGTIKHVMSGVNPQGCQVFSFKQPSARGPQPRFPVALHQCLPERGRIGIFNRSYYEEVLVVRVHPEILERQKLAANREQAYLGRAAGRYRPFRGLSDPPGHVILKFFLTSQGRAEETLYGASRPAGEELEVLRCRCPRAETSGTTTCRPSRRRSEPLPRNTRPGLWCRQTTNGSRASLLPRRSSGRRGAGPRISEDRRPKKKELAAARAELAREL